MIVFHNVRWKNFLLTGNVWSEYVLDKNSTTLIVGKNGVGKSTLLDALCFGLYGHGFRDIKRGMFVNSINDKNMEVEVEFSTQNNRYKVRRGLKPTFFEIICNGNVMTELPSSDDMQDYLEQYVLKCNYKAFTQVVILGSASYTPFMKLKPQARRDILEDVLDIEVFSVMHALVKKQLKSTNDELIQAQNELRIVESKHDLARTYADQWTQQQSDKRQRLTNQQTRLQNHLDTLTTTNDAAFPELLEWEKIEPQVPEWQDKLNKANRLVTKFDAERQHLALSHQFFAEHDQCPTCTQEIDATFKATQLDTSQTALDAVTSKALEAQELVTILNGRLKSASVLQQQVRNQETARQRVLNDIANTTRDLERLADEIAATYDPPPPPPQDLGDVDAAQATADQWSYVKQVQEQCNTLLKDSGIRTRIIQQYIPTR